jgi:hypothetical protein
MNMMVSAINGLVLEGSGKWHSDPILGLIVVNKRIAW